MNDSALLLGAWLSFAGVTITALSGVLVAVIRNARSTRERLGVAEREVCFQSMALSFTDMAYQFGVLDDRVWSILDETEIDRVLLLRAYNGKMAPKWTTAVRQWRTRGQEGMTYVRVELDEDYVRRLRNVVNGGAVIVSTACEDETALLRRIYETEGVRHAAWYFVGQKKVPDDPQSVMITYVSAATHDERPITHSTKMKFERFCVDLLKQMHAELDSASPRADSALRRITHQNE